MTRPPDPLELHSPGPLGVLVGLSPGTVFADGPAVRAIWRGPRDTVFGEGRTEAEALAALAVALRRIDVDLAAEESKP